MNGLDIANYVYTAGNTGTIRAIGAKGTWSGVTGQIQAVNAPSATQLNTGYTGGVSIITGTVRDAVTKII